MSILDSLARYQLWGGGNMKKRPSLIHGLIGDFQYFVLGNKDRRLPSAFHLIDWWIEKSIREWLTGPIEPDRLPAGLPARIYETVDKIVLYRGGLLDKEREEPAFWTERSKCSVTPFSYVIPVYYQLAADPKKVASWEEALEDQLAAAGYDLNVRVALRPLRIEIDKDRPPVITLADHWSEIAKLPTNESLCVPGVALQSGELALLQYALVNDQLSNRVVGSPGSGKTQLTLGMILTLCYLNSPQYLSLIIIDPKVVDWLPLANLPHLSAPIAKSAVQGLVLLEHLVDEMDNRMRQAEHGLKVAQMRPVIVYIDEMADLLSSLPKAQQERVVTAVQRLTQTGRGLRIGIIGATQRIFELPAPMYSKMNGKFVGKTANAGDGAAAAGESGVQTHKLPGKGAFELYPANIRLQGFFVADPDRDDYADQLGRFAGNILTRWVGQRPHWQPHMVEPATGNADGGDSGQEEIAQVDPFLETALAAYLADPNGFTKRELRRLHKEDRGTEISGDTASKLWERLMEYGRAKFNRTGDM